MPDMSKRSCTPEGWVWHVSLSCAGPSIYEPFADAFDSASDASNASYVVASSIILQGPAGQLDICSDYCRWCVVCDDTTVQMSRIITAASIGSSVGTRPWLCAKSKKCRLWSNKCALGHVSRSHASARLARVFPTSRVLFSTQSAHCCNLLDGGYSMLQTRGLLYML